MFARVLSLRDIILTITLMLSAISSHAFYLSLPQLYTAARAASPGGGYGFTNKYLQPESDKSTVLSEELLPPIMTRTSYPDIACPITPPIFFVWMGSEPKFKHKKNMLEWYYKGHPVVLWYHSEGLSQNALQKFKNIEKVCTDSRICQHRILVLDIADAGLDSLSPGGVSITEMIGSLTRAAKHSNPRLYATASNLARLALLVKGQPAITGAVQTRNNRTLVESARIDMPDFHHTGVVYMDTDIYFEKSGGFNLPHHSKSYGVHIFKDSDGKLRMNNDIMYSQLPNQPFFTELLQEVLEKFDDATRRQAYKEFMDAEPPQFNGAHFVRRRLSEDLSKEPAIFLDIEPQKTEGNWHPRGIGYKNELPSGSSP